MYRDLTHEEALTYTRENTGKALCDSGGENGRHWQQPPDPERIILYPHNTDKGDYCDFWDASINTTALLAKLFEQHEEFTDDYDLYANLEDNCRTSHFELVDEFMRARGYELVAEDNTYNNEQDLSQDFVYRVWQHVDKDYSADWIWNNSGRYDEDAQIIVVHVHTGADIRGGYSRPLIGRFTGDYSVPLDLKVEWFVEGDSDLAHDCNDNGYFSNGYGRRPDDTFKPLYWRDGRLVCLEKDAEDGELYELTPYEPYWGE